MQIDMFGGSSEEDAQPSSPPVIDSKGAWRGAEVVAFDAYLRSGDLAAAISLLKGLTTEAAARVLLESGFALTTMKNRPKMMADVQADLLAAARRKMTGHEWRAAKVQVVSENEGASVGAGELKSASEQIGNDYAESVQPGDLRREAGLSGGIIGSDSSGDRQPMGDGMARPDDQAHHIGRAAGPAQTPDRLGEDSSVGAGAAAAAPLGNGAAGVSRSAPGGPPAEVAGSTDKTDSSDAQSEFYQLIKSAWERAISESGSFLLQQGYPAIVTINGVTRRFAVSKASGSGPFLLTAFVRGPHGPQFNKYQLSHQGELKALGSVNLWAMAPEAREERINEFKAVFASTVPTIAARSGQSAEQDPKSNSTEADSAAVVIDPGQARAEGAIGEIKQPPPQLVETAVPPEVRPQVPPIAGTQADEIHAPAEIQVQADRAPVAVPAAAEKANNTEASPDHVIRESDNIGSGGLLSKYRDNIRAIQIIKTLEQENRAATDDELPLLARYVGWGGLKGVFDPENKIWAEQHGELKALLTDAEWSASSRSQLDAFYTSSQVVGAMYSAVRRLGFGGGRVIDPSIGSGNFIGMMPLDMRQSSQFYGVELDILTSRIASALYPSAQIAKATGFQDFNAAPGSFDLVIGNPPFGSQAIVDSKGSAYSGWSIHNYFFAKGIDITRPGALLCMVVSNSFLDKLDPQVREWIGQRAELVSGVRLPNTAFKANANTDVVTDILIFRRIDERNILGPQIRGSWLETEDVELKNPKTGETSLFSVNKYFLENPGQVLGTHSSTGSMYRANSYTVVANGDLAQQLESWVESLPTGLYTPIDRSSSITPRASDVEIPQHVKEGSFFEARTATGPAVYLRLTDLDGQQRSARWDPPNERALARMRGMIELRDLLREQLAMERSSNADEAQIEKGRFALNKAYDKFQSTFGFVNDAVNRNVFRDDTESPLIQALEFDYEKGISQAYAQEHGIPVRPARAVKADIFKQRVLFPPGGMEIVHTAKDALLHSLNTLGRVDIDYMKEAYGRPEKQILDELDDLLFRDPSGTLVTADDYLSGDVKSKLEAALNASKDDPAFKKNVDALQKVIPADKLPSEIHAAIGANWIDPKYFEEFGREITGGTLTFAYVRSTGQWLMGETRNLDFTKSHTQFGTVKMSAAHILTHLMNGRAPEVKKVEMVDGQERYVTDEEQTEAARQAADKIKEHWESWLWNDAERTTKLAQTYNDRFNRTVERKYDGAHLSFPGMTRNIELLKSQKNAVWRGLQDRVMLLDHVVGAGKTFVVIATVMEAKRLGISKKPWLVVPNHLTLQWRSEFYRLYPGANVLAATPSDFDADNRERFFSKIATGNWDAVIIGHSSLKKVPLPLGVEENILNEQLEDISDAIEEQKKMRGDRHVVRDMEKIKANLEAKIKKLKEKTGSKSKVVDISDLGVDALIVDESHEFKNLWFNTQMQRVAGLGNPAGSGKAFDLFIKTRWLQEEFGESALLIHATGTPVSNSLAEMFTVQRYMQYPEMRRQGLHVFDAWAKLYGDVQNVYEVAPSGTGYRLSQRFSKFKNLGSLMGSYRSFADVVTLQDLKKQELARGKVFPVPQLLSGRPINVVVPRSPLQEAFFGIPEVTRDDNGRIRFELTLDDQSPVKIVKADDGKYEVHQTRGDLVIRSPRRYETQEEAEYMTALNAITPTMTLDPDSIIGQFDNLRELTRRTKGKINALSLTSLANKAGLDYRLIDPAAQDDPKSKINEAIGNMISLWEQYKDVRGVQLAFCDLSVPLSAKAKMASNEKRVYIRTADGQIRHAMGTLHTVREYEGCPYYVVGVGRGKDKSYSIYDPSTGQAMKEGLESKRDAHTFVAQFLSKEDGTERWLDQRELSKEIDDIELDEYKSSRGLDVEGDSADNEFSKADIDGATGVAEFSVYDDMKAKLIANGVPPEEIEFIHDHDTPQAKHTLFKRCNSGEVRFLFGSGPKMGAGTNVQRLIVAIHNIDAPYRPSDLEQREGRGIRRGNALYERDPDGFRLAVYRYATSQTYDTRRWQLLEHKASGIEQLRNYTVGLNEIDDVATEAANSADMKAAASGNPLILRETQLSTEVKKLKSLERAHRDGQFIFSSKLRHHEYIANDTGPRRIRELHAMVEKRDSATSIGSFGRRILSDKDDLMDALDEIRVRLAGNSKNQTMTYCGLDFTFERSSTDECWGMHLPDGQVRVIESFSRSGIATRMENFCRGLESRIHDERENIRQSQDAIAKLKPLLGKEFNEAEALQAAIQEHGKVQRALRKSSSLSAVRPEHAVEFAAAVASQKAFLQKMGFGRALSEIEREDEIERIMVSDVQEPPDHLPSGVFVGAILEISKDHFVQKIGRDGQTMKHHFSNLDTSHGQSGLVVGEVVSVDYQGSVGLIVHEAKSSSIER